MRSLFFVFFAAFVCFETQAQWRKDFNYRFIARVMDADTAVFIPNCHVINKTQNLGTISDQHGSFTVTANVGDSIMFSFLGYERLTIAVNDTMYTNDRIIKLIPTAYELPEVRIGRFSTYERFKREFLSLEAQEAIRMEPLVNQNSLYVPRLPNQGGINVPMGSLSHPVSLLYDLWSKEGKQKRHYQSVVKGTADFMVIGNKFNGYIVKRLTGLENDELIKFMSFCGFSNSYLLAASEMEIQRAIMSKYSEYMRIKNEAV
jgi:hypothetical protein